MFYYFRLEDQVPKNHLLRLIEKHIRFEFVRERLKDSYSETGRPSIGPELLLRILGAVGVPSDHLEGERFRSCPELAPFKPATFTVRNVQTIGERGNDYFPIKFVSNATFCSPEPRP